MKDEVDRAALEELRVALAVDHYKGSLGDLTAALSACGLEVVETELLRQVFGMAGEGCTAPLAAPRWCERIDEVFYNGPMGEYEDYAIDIPRRAASLSDGGE